jgi:hypothetical protein
MLEFCHQQVLLHNHGHSSHTYSLQHIHRYIYKHGDNIFKTQQFSTIYNTYPITHTVNTNTVKLF